MFKDRKRSLFAVTMCGMFLILGCNAQMDESNPADSGGEAVEELGQPLAGPNVACDPRVGTHGQVWTVGSALTEYVYHQGWCGVGTVSPPRCVMGRYFYSQSFVSQLCWTTGSSGSCYDNNAWWYVTCNSLIDCVYDCNGQCVPSSC